MVHRAATVAGLLTNVFFGFLRASVLIALYGPREEVADISIQGAITYTGLTQAIIAYLSIFGWFEIMNSVYSGEVGSDLLKPLGYFSFWLAQDIGRAVAGADDGLHGVLGRVFLAEGCWGSGVDGTAWARAASRRGRAIWALGNCLRSCMLSSTNTH